MRRLGLLVLLLLSCLRPGDFATVAPADAFEGARIVTVVGSAEDVDQVEQELERRDFDVRRVVEGVTVPTTRYVVKIDGVCGSSFVGIDPTLAIEVFDTGRSVFHASVKNVRGCPETFFVDAAEGLARAWPVKELRDGGL